MEKLDMKYWDSLKAAPCKMDSDAIANAFASHSFTDQQKADLAQLILASRMRVTDENRAAELNDAVAIFNHDFAIEEFFYTEYTQLYCTWRYSFKEYSRALPLAWAMEGIRQIYSQLGVTLDDEEVMKVYNSDNVYSAFFELLSETMKDNRYIVPTDNENWNSFAFVSYFNMWKIFGVLGFAGYSPYVLCADIGLLTPPASHWHYACFDEAELKAIDELRSRARGRRYPTYHQNRFMGLLGRI